VGSSGPGASLPGSSGKASKVCSSMLFPRCFHRRLCRVLFHEFHTTRPYLRESLDAFQIDLITARAIIDPTRKPSSPGLSQSKSNGRKPKTLRAGKQSKEKSDRTECLSDSVNLSSRLRLYDRRVRYPRTVGGANVIGPHLARLLLNGRLSSPRPPTEREAHLGASENAGGSSCPFHSLFFIYFPAQSSPSDYRENTPHLPSSLPYSCGVDGVIRPRAGGDPFLEGEVLFVAMGNIPQPI
jgi:hypothetical protein